MKSGGYSVSKLLAQVRQDITVVWGAADEVLGPEGGEALAKQLPHARCVAGLVWMRAACMQARGTCFNEQGLGSL